MSTADAAIGNPPYQRHSATSRAAAARIEPTAGTSRARVLGLVVDSGRTTPTLSGSPAVVWIAAEFKAS